MTSLRPHYLPLHPVGTKVTVLSIAVARLKGSPLDSARGELERVEGSRYVICEIIDHHFPRSLAGGKALNVTNAVGFERLGDEVLNRLVVLDNEYSSYRLQSLFSGRFSHRRSLEASEPHGNVIGAFGTSFRDRLIRWQAWWGE